MKRNQLRSLLILCLTAAAVKTSFASQPINNRPPCTPPRLIPVPAVTKRRLPGLPRFLLSLLLIASAATQYTFAGCDGFGGDGGNCAAGGGGSLLVFTTNGVSVTVSGVDGLIFSSVVIPTSYYGLPVTSIGPSAFYGNYITSVTIPDSVTNIGDRAFFNCISLTSVTIPNSVTSIGDSAFENGTSLTNVTIGNGVTVIGSETFAGCPRLSSVTIPNSVSNIGAFAFAGCPSLTSVTIPKSVTDLGAYAFASCSSLTGIYFQGNAPVAGEFLFDRDNSAAAYFLPGTTGWGATFGGRPTALWSLPNPLILNYGPSFGVQTNGFGFIISWATNISVVVEACTYLATPAWSPVATNTLTGGWSYFTDPQWTNYPARFYRLRSP